MRRRGVVVAAVATLMAVGCASLPPPPELLLRLPPALLGRSLALEQRLRVQAQGREAVLEALLEADATALRLALLALQRPLARIEWDGVTLRRQVAAGWPAELSAHLSAEPSAELSAERLLADLTLTLWPAEAIAAALPAGWTLDADAQRRELRWQGRTVQRVEYHRAGRVTIEHLQRGYRIEIESVPIGNSR